MLQEASLMILHYIHGISQIRVLIIYGKLYSQIIISRVSTTPYGINKDLNTIYT